MRLDLDGARRARPGSARAVLRAGAGLLRTWWQRHRSRRHLAEMEPRLLRDIGVSRLEAGEEARKWFWQP